MHCEIWGGGKKDSKHYVGQILEVDGEAYKIKFLRITLGVKFMFPQKDDVAWIQKNWIVSTIRVVTGNHISAKSNLQLQN